MVDLSDLTIKKKFSLSSDRGLDTWSRRGGNRESFLFQHIGASNTDNILSNYKVFVGYEDSGTTRRKVLTLKSFS